MLGTRRRLADLMQPHPHARDGLHDLLDDAAARAAGSKADRAALGPLIERCIAEYNTRQRSLLERPVPSVLMAPLEIPVSSVAIDPGKKRGVRGGTILYSILITLAVGLAGAGFYFAVIVAIPLAVVLAYINSRRTIWKFRASRKAIACPRCGYSLAGLGAPIPASLSNGIEFGPRGCPECGTSWPMVPPEPAIPS